MARHLPADETELVRLAASCDDEAFSALVDLFGRCVRNVIARFTTDPDDSEDLYSEIVARLLDGNKRALRAWEPRAPFAAYLTTIAARHCLDWSRSRGRLPDIPLPPAEEDDSVTDLIERVAEAPAGAEPQTRIEKRELQTVLHHALQRLCAEDRLVLYFRFEQELPGKQIAHLMGCSPGAARQRLFRALRRLQAELEDLSPGLFDLQ